MARDKSAKAKDNPFYSDANVKELEKKIRRIQTTQRCYQTRSFDRTKAKRLSTVMY